MSRVVIDPGHGGKDTGAVGPGGVREKDVTLDVAHRVAPVLAGQGIQVVLTRDDDRFVSLEERTARANAFDADLFVSIHCNASESTRPARHRDVRPRHDARRDRRPRGRARERDHPGGQRRARVHPRRHADGRRGAALDAVRPAPAARRARPPSQTQYADVVDGGVHTAGFYVLVGARMPSVLFETSYISNATDEQRLGSDDYRQLVADAIANAVKAYREGR